MKNDGNSKPWMPPSPFTLWLLCAYHTKENVFQPCDFEMSCPSHVGLLFLMY